MIQRHTAANGVVVYQSTRFLEIGIPHAFSTRIGGVSAGPFASLNLGNPAGQPQQDTPENIRKNYHLLQQAIGAESRKRYFAHQVHGACVVDPEITTPSDHIHGGTELGKADALVSDKPDTLLTVRVADCVPILLASADGKKVAAIHAGWRGVIAQAVIEAAKRFDRPDQLLVAIGPCISVDHFEVGLEVADIFKQSFGDETPYQTRPDAPGKSRIDLHQALRIQLMRLGIDDSHIELSDRCTVRDADEFFSHRRDNGLTGRMAAMIGAKS